MSIGISTGSRCLSWTPTKYQGEWLKRKRPIVTRARELFHAAGDNVEEEQALDDAM